MTGVAIGLATEIRATAPDDDRPERDRLVLDRERLASRSHLSGAFDWEWARIDDPARALATEIDALAGLDWVPADPFRLDARWRGDVATAWPGVGWFRASFDVAEDLVDVPLAILVEHVGAVEVYSDGGLIVESGVIGEDRAMTRAAVQQRPAVVWFDRPGPHRLIVRYANHRVDDSLRVGRWGGFFVRIGLAEHMIAWDAAKVDWRAGTMGWFLGIFLSFAVLHLLLYAFHREIRANLDFAVLCLFSAALVWLLLVQDRLVDPAWLIQIDVVMNIFGVLWGLAAVGFVYRVFLERTPRIHRLFFVPVAAILAIVSPFVSGIGTSAIFLFLLAVSAEMVRVVVVALRAGRPGARTVGAGVAILALCFSAGLLANLGLLPRSRTIGVVVPFLGLVALVGSMSVYLSSVFARIHRDLRQQLSRVEELSAEQVAQARRLGEEAVARTRLEAEVSRKAAELEEARELQLSMLPESMPEHPGFELAAFMETATEVGGDYYDFATAENGELVVAIGDATGHGLRAGTMVTATKTLFQMVGREPDLSRSLGRSARALRGMNLKRLAMALTLARFENGQLRVAAAGMPPVLVFRAATGAVETFLVGGMPLGGRLSFPYREVSTPIAGGDVVLMMSDGFPERRGPDDALLGYARAESAFAASAARDSAPQSVIGDLRDEAERWAAGEAADDDVTFVVVRVS